MPSIKLTPLLLFLLILFVLVLSNVICKRYLNVEGFVSFQKSKAVLDSVLLPQYSATNQVTKIYDNLFFDTKNGNVIEVTEKQLGPIGQAARNAAITAKALADATAATPVTAVTAATLAAATATDSATQLILTNLKKPIIDAAAKAAADLAAATATTTADAKTALTLADTTAKKAVVDMNSEITAAQNLSGTGADDKTDVSGTTIETIYIVKRDGTVNLSGYKTELIGGDVKPTDTAESKITSTTSAYISWGYVTHKTKTDDQYQLFYMPWNTTTYLHIIKLGTDATGTNVSSMLFGSGDIKANHPYTTPQSAIPITGDAEVSDASNNTYVKNSYYDSSKNLYQLGHNVQYDIANGNLISQTTPTSIDIYDRTGAKTTSTSTTATNTTTTLSESPFSPNIITTNNYMVLYTPSAQNTLVALLIRDPANKVQFTLANVKRFTHIGIDTANTNTPPPITTTNVSGGPSGDGSSDYWKWFWYWNTNGGSGDNKGFNNDYMLKTQIIPPVCPTCPNCPGSSGSGVCTDCGGQGGSGTQTGNGSSVGGTVLGTVDEAGNVINKTVNTAGNIVNKTVDTAGNLLYATGSGATGLVKSAGSGVGQVFNSAGDLVYAAGSGATGLLRSAGTGVTNILGNANNNYGGPGYSNQGYGNQGNQEYGNQDNKNQGYIGKGSGAPGIDQYSYYGALPPKGSDFMPVTASFSAFGK